MKIRSLVLLGTVFFVCHTAFGMNGAGPANPQPAAAPAQAAAAAPALEQCPICLEGMPAAPKDAMRYPQTWTDSQLFDCPIAHKFHSNCLATHINTNANACCPFCRRKPTSLGRLLVAAHTGDMARMQTIIAAADAATATAHPELNNAYPRLLATNNYEALCVANAAGHFEIICNFITTANLDQFDWQTIDIAGLTEHSVMQNNNQVLAYLNAHVTPLQRLLSAARFGRRLDNGAESNTGNIEGVQGAIAAGAKLESNNYEAIRVASDNQHFDVICHCIRTTQLAGLDLQTVDVPALTTYATAQNDAQTLRYLADHNRPATERLLAAAHDGHLAGMDMAIHAGASLAANDYEALRIAATNNHFGIICHYAQNQALPGINWLSMPNMSTILDYATVQKDWPALLYFAQHFPVAVLVHAAHGGYLAVMQAAIAAGAELDASNYEALRKAAANNHFNVLCYYVKNTNLSAVDWHTMNVEGILDYATEHDDQALQHFAAYFPTDVLLRAARTGKAAIVQAAITAGASLAANNYEAIHVAAANGHFNLICNYADTQYLANFDWHLPNLVQIIEYAVTTDNKPAVTYFVKKFPAEILALGARIGNIEIMQAAITAGASLAANNYEAIRVAAANNHFNVVCAYANHQALTNFDWNMLPNINQILECADNARHWQAVRFFTKKFPAQCLVLSARRGSLTDMQEAIAAGAALAANDYEALRAAADANHFDIICHFLKDKDVHLPNINWHAMHIVDIVAYAIAHEDQQVIRFFAKDAPALAELIETDHADLVQTIIGQKKWWNGTNLTIDKKELLAVMCRLAEAGHTNAVQWFYENYSETHDALEQALRAAITHDKALTVAYLLDQHPPKTVIKNCTYLAAGVGSANALRQLFEKYSFGLESPGKETYKYDVDIPDMLMDAAMAGRVEVVRHLSALPESRQSLPAALRAAIKGATFEHDAIVSNLIADRLDLRSLLAQVAARQASPDGTDLEIVKRIVAQGANQSLLDATAALAIHHHRYDIARFLIDGHHICIPNAFFFAAQYKLARTHTLELVGAQELLNQATTAQASPQNADLATVKYMVESHRVTQPVIDETTARAMERNRQDLIPYLVEEHRAHLPNVFLIAQQKEFRNAITYLFQTIGPKNLLAQATALLNNQNAVDIAFIKHMVEIQHLDQNLIDAAAAHAIQNDRTDIMGYLIDEHHVHVPNVFFIAQQENLAIAMAYVLAHIDLHELLKQATATQANPASADLAFIKYLVETQHVDRALVDEATAQAMQNGREEITRYLIDGHHACIPNTLVFAQQKELTRAADYMLAHIGPRELLHQATGLQANPGETDLAIVKNLVEAQHIPQPLIDEAAVHAIQNNRTALAQYLVDERHICIPNVFFIAQQQGLAQAAAYVLAHVEPRELVHSATAAQKSPEGADWALIKHLNEVQQVDQDLIDEAAARAMEHGRVDIVPYLFDGHRVRIPHVFFIAQQQNLGRAIAYVLEHVSAQDLVAQATAFQPNPEGTDLALVKYLVEVKLIDQTLIDRAAAYAVQHGRTDIMEYLDPRANAPQSLLIAQQEQLLHATDYTVQKHGGTLDLHEALANAVDLGDTAAYKLIHEHHADTRSQAEALLLASQNHNDAMVVAVLGSCDDKTLATALNQAIARGLVSLVDRITEELLSHEQPVNLYEAVRHAVNAGHTKVVRLLIEKYHAPFDRNELLLQAIENDMPEMVQYLAGSEPIEPRKQHELLCHAARAGSLSVVRGLIKDLHFAGSLNTVAHWAHRYGHINVVRYLTNSYPTQLDFASLKEWAHGIGASEIERLLAAATLAPSSVIQNS